MALGDMLLGVVIGEATIGVRGANERGDANDLRALRGTLMSGCDEWPLDFPSTAWSMERASSDCVCRLGLDNLRTRMELDDEESKGKEKGSPGGGDEGKLDGGGGEY